MKRNACRSLALVIIFLILSPSTGLKAETLSGSLGGEASFHLILLFCTVLTAICLVGICLAVFLKKN